MACHDLDDKVGNHRFERASLKSSLYLFWIFKDADALDRFRIASNALDIQFLRTDAAKKMVSFSENLVEKTLSLQPVLEQDRYLIVVDMQNDFVTGTLGTEQAREILPFVAKKIKDFPGNIVFTMDSHKEDYLSTQEGNMLPVPHCIAGTHGWQIIPEIKRLQERRKFALYTKNVFGSVKMAMDMVQLCKKQPVREIELIGLCTDICVISNAVLLRNMLPDIPIYIDAACCAGTTPEKHKAALDIMESCQIRVRKRGKKDVM